MLEHHADILAQFANGFLARRLLEVRWLPAICSWPERGISSRFSTRSNELSRRRLGQAAPGVSPAGQSSVMSNSAGESAVAIDTVKLNTHAQN